VATAPTPEEAYRDAPPGPAELSEDMRRLSQLIQGTMPSSKRREYLLRHAALADRGALLAASEAAHYTRSRSVQAKEVRILREEMAKDAVRTAMELQEYDRTAGTTLGPIGPDTADVRGYVRSEYLAWSIRR
jgi:hypothetical protein